MRNEFDEELKEITERVERILNFLKEGKVITASYAIKYLALDLDKIGYGEPLRKLEKERG